MVRLGSVLSLVIAAPVWATYKEMDLRGDIWPKPRDRSVNKDRLFMLDVTNLELEFAEKGQQTACDEMYEDNARRYSSMMKLPILHYYGTNTPGESLSPVSTIKKVIVSIENLSSCTVYPHAKMDESYTIEVSETGVSINSPEIWGTIRAFETLSQSIFWNDETNCLIFEQTIQDEPEFSHRGFMIDTARHFLTWEVMEQFLDGMAYNKLNLIHWHMVDAQSFAYKSEVFPFLSENAAFKPEEKHTYSIPDIKNFIERAKMRGIRIVPEIDSPGHMHTLCDGFSKQGYNFCTRCEGNVWDKDQMDEFFGWGPFRPDLEENYELLETLWTELRTVFKDDIMHLGGDEVPTGCWLKDENVKKWAEEQGFENDSQIMRYHLDRLYEITKKVGFARTQVWNEAEGFESADTDEMDKRVKDPSEKPIIHSWMPWGSGYPTGFENILDRATSEGYDVVLSSGWYLDLITYPSGGHGADWTTYYKINPLKFLEGKPGNTDEQRKHLIGGEVAWWTEYIDSAGIIPRSFPRASAIAERLWTKWEDTSAGQSNGVEDAFPRLDKFRCLMINRDINAEPIGVPSSCAKEYDVKYLPPWVVDDGGDEPVTDEPVTASHAAALPRTNLFHYLLLIPVFGFFF